MGALPKSPLGRHVHRRASRLVSEAMGDTRVVLVVGPRQSGKSTLVMQVNQDVKGAWYTLDKSSTRSAAEQDPDGFVDSHDVMLIDEVQRVPELLLSLKAKVDSDMTPGQFLLTGSAKVLALQSVPDTLPGRLETVELWPLSQGEICGTPETFVDRAFNGDSFRGFHSPLSKRDYVDRLVAGGFPESLARQGRRRRAFHDSYLADLVNREVLQVADVRNKSVLHQLLPVLATRSGGVFVPSRLANDLAVSSETVNHYVRLFDEAFLVKLIPAWSRNISTRATGASKIAFVDSGLAANILGQNESRLMRADSTMGGLFEGFVAMELARQLTWSDTPVAMFHYRTRDNIEVDLILEDRAGRVVAIEVKAGSTVRGDDFRGIRHVQQRLGNDFLAGFVLHTGSQTLPFGENLTALPASALWEL